MEIDKMTIREVMEMTRKMSIKKGGLQFIIEKIVMEIEKLQENKASDG